MTFQERVKHHDTLALGLALGLAVFCAVIALMATVDKREAETQLRIVNTEVACYEFGYHGNHGAQCLAAQKEYDTKHKCDVNECWAEVK